MPFGHLHFLSGKMCIQFFCQLFNLLTLSRVSCLYMWNINPILFHTVYKYFLPFSRLLFSMVSLAVQKTLSLIRSHLLFLFLFPLL